MTEKRAEENHKIKELSIGMEYQHPEPPTLNNSSIPTGATLKISAQCSCGDKVKTQLPGMICNLEDTFEKARAAARKAHLSSLNQTPNP